MSSSAYFGNLIRVPSSFRSALLISCRRFCLVRSSNRKPRPLPKFIITCCHSVLLSTVFSQSCACLFALINCAVCDEAAQIWADGSSSDDDSASGDASDGKDQQEQDVDDTVASLAGPSLVSAVANAGIKPCVCFACGKNSDEVCFVLFSLLQWCSCLRLCVVLLNQC